MMARIVATGAQIDTMREDVSAVMARLGGLKMILNRLAEKHGPQSFPEYVGMAYREASLEAHHLLEKAADDGNWIDNQLPERLDELRFIMQTSLSPRPAKWDVVGDDHQDERPQIKKLANGDLQHESIGRRDDGDEPLAAQLPSLPKGGFDVGWGLIREGDFVGFQDDRGLTRWQVVSVFQDGEVEIREAPKGTFRSVVAHRVVKWGLVRPWLSLA